MPPKMNFRPAVEACGYTLVESRRRLGQAPGERSRAEVVVECPAGHRATHLWDNFRPRVVAGEALHRPGTGCAQCRQAAPPPEPVPDGFELLNPPMLSTQAIHRWRCAALGHTLQAAASDLRINCPACAAIRDAADRGFPRVEWDGDYSQDAALEVRLFCPGGHLKLATPKTLSFFHGCKRCHRKTLGGNPAEVLAALPVAPPAAPAPTPAAPPMMPERGHVSTVATLADQVAYLTHVVEEMVTKFEQPCARINEHGI